MPQPRPSQTRTAAPAVEVDVMTVRSEAVRAVRVIRDRSRQDARREHVAAPPADDNPTSSG